MTHDHGMLDTRNRVEVSAETYRKLMHDLTMAGINTPAANGSGWVGAHPKYGSIEVARIDRPPGHAHRHPAVGFFVSGDPEVTNRITREVDARSSE